MPIVRHHMGLQNMNNRGEYVRRIHIQFSQNLAKDAGKYLPQPQVALSMLAELNMLKTCLLYTSPSPRDKRQSRMPSSA